MQSYKEIASVHEFAHDPMDGGKEGFQVLRPIGAISDAEEGRVQRLNALTFRDIKGGA